MAQANNVVSIPQSLAKRRPYAEIVEVLNLRKIPGTREAKAPLSRTHGSAAVNDTLISEGGRNTMLASLAGGMRRRGMCKEAIEAALQQENLARCNPPLHAAEVSATAASIANYPASDPDSVLRSLTDAGNATRFGARYKDDLRYVPERDAWFFWEGQRWRQDDRGLVMERAKHVARDIYLERDVVSDDKMRVAIAKHARASQQAPRLKAMVELAQSLPELVAPLTAFDQDDLMLGVQNGVIDLRSGKLRDASRGDLMTRQAPVRFDPKATCPIFIRFLKTVFASERALIDFVQRVVGYALTGLTHEQCLFFLFGHGANGKSTLLNVLLELLGSDYARQTPSETLMAKRGGNGAAASSDIARLQGVRVTTANEIEDGSLLAESRVKQLTGGDLITSRFLYREHFEFKPKLKLFIAGNHKPIIRGDDHGIWRRIDLIPFDVQIPPEQRDPRLMDKLRREFPGVLNWAIKGCLDWQKRGLAPPAPITDAVKAYRSEMDVMGQWIAECCDSSPSATWRASFAYDSYKCWATHNGFKPMTSTAFGRKLGERFKKVNRREGTFYLGIGGAGSVVS